MKISTVLITLALLLAPTLQKDLFLTGENTVVTHWNYVIGIIVFISVLQIVGLAIDTWYKKSLSSFLEKSGGAGEMIIDTEN